MSRFRRCNSDTDRLEITHLTDQNNIRIFAQRGAQRIGIALGVQTDLPLVYHRHFVLMKILDGIFQGNDMGVPVVIDFIDNGGKCRRFTASGGPRDENQPSFSFIQVYDGFGDAERFGRRNFGTDEAERQRNGTSLLIGIDTVSAKFGNRKRHIVFPPLFESFPLRLRHDFQ